MKNSNVQTTAKNVNSKKEILENSKNLLNDEQLLNLDLDSIDDTNFENLLKNVSSTIKQQKTDKERIYKKENLTKSDRQKLRKNRDKFLNNVILFFQNKDTENLKKEIQSFDKYYKETYFKNDYSQNSICQNNSDTDTKLKVKLFLEIIKKSK